MFCVPGKRWAGRHDYTRGDHGGQGNFQSCSSEAQGVGSPVRELGLDRFRGGPYTEGSISPRGGAVTNPARHDEAGVSVLTGTRADRFAAALDGFFNTVQLAGLLTRQP